MSKTKTNTQTMTADPTTLAREGQMWRTANTLASQPHQAYGGDRVAGMTPMMEQGAAALPGAVAAGGGAVNAGLGMATAAGAYDPTMVNAHQAGPVAQVGGDAISQWLKASGGGGSVGARDVTSVDAAAKMGQYVNPYTGQVVDAALSDLDRQRQRAVMQTQAQKMAGGAFGGSRHGVSDSLTNEAAIRAAGALSGELRGKAFDTAAGLGAADANRDLQGQMSNQQADVATGTANLNAGLSRFGTMAGIGTFNAGAMNNAEQFNAGMRQTAETTNQGAGLTANGQRLAAAGTMGNLGQTQQNMALQGADALYKGGQIEQGIEQAEKNAAYEAWQMKQADPFNKLGFLQGFQGSKGVTQTNKEKGSALGGIVGGIATIAGGPLGGAISRGVSGLFGGGGQGAAVTQGLLNPMLDPTVRGGTTPAPYTMPLR